ncbi:MAG: transcriptional repressor [Clostridiales bacterium]|nr:transcriptional repressor [Clostridiales bacterium]
MRRNAALILEIIDHSREHLTAEEIYLRLKAQGAKAVLATVYNNLADLYTQGLIRKVSVEGCPDRYDRMERHDHLVCRRCGKLSDIMLEDLTQKLEQSVGIQILSYDLKISYLCEDCRRKEQQED